MGVVLQELINSDIGRAVQSLLNSALVDDTLDDGYVCMIVHTQMLSCISIYLESSSGDKVPFGKRATMYLNLEFNY